jgi:ketosteroid isomerase-like protein
MPGTPRLPLPVIPSYAVRLVHNNKLKGRSPMRLHRNLAVALMLFAFLGSSLAFAKDASKDEQSIRDLDAAWSHAAGTKDLEKTVSFYTDDASMLPSNMPIANGKDAIRGVWSQLMSLPGFSISFGPTKIVVSKCDLAYEIGTFQLTLNDAQGKPAISVGKYVVNWQKHAGQWKAVVDIFNNDK